MLATLLALHLLASSQTPPPIVSEPPRARAPGPGPGLQWYGRETLIADGATTLATATGFVLQASSVQAVGAGLSLSGIVFYLFVSPILHATHGNWGLVGALGSFGLRIGMLLTSSFIGGLAGAGRGLSTEGFLTGASVGAVVGQVIGASLDAYYNPWEPVPGAAQPSASTSSLRWAPFAGSVRGAPVAGVAGIF